MNADALRRHLEKSGAYRARKLAEVEAVNRDLAAVMRKAAKAGISEVEIAQLTGVSRISVRKWLGKD